jgi:hypothetical protein
MNEIYHIELQSKWGKSYDVKIEGTVSPAAVQKLQPTANLKKEFFDDYGLSISNYLLLLPSNATIYIGRHVRSFDPIEIDEQDNERAFIPETLIDYTKTYNYVRAKRYVFEISSGVKRYKNVLIEDNYFKDIRKKITDKLKTIDDFIIDDISTDVRGIDVLTTNTYLDELDKERQQLIEKYKTFIIQKQNNYEDEHRALYEQTIRAKEAETRYENKKTELMEQLKNIPNIAAENDRINNILIEVENCIYEILNILSSDPRFENENIPTYSELYERAQDIVNNRA